jgi:hypothetical protein
MYTSFVGIPTSIEIKEDYSSEKFKCSHCTRIIKNKYLLIDNGTDEYKTFCSKCARQYLDSLEAKFKYFAGQVMILNHDSFPKTKKEKPSDINIIESI